MENKPKECPFCGGRPEIVSVKVGPWTGFSRSLHRCKLIGYIGICDWTEGGEDKLNFTKWNTRVPIAQQANYATGHSVNESVPVA